MRAEPHCRGVGAYLGTVAFVVQLSPGSDGLLDVRKFLCIRFIFTSSVTYCAFPAVHSQRIAPWAPGLVKSTADARFSPPAPKKLRTAARLSEAASTLVLLLNRKYQHQPASSIALAELSQSLVIQYKNKATPSQPSHTAKHHRLRCAFASISPIFPGYLSTYALSPSRSPFKVSQPSLPSQFSLPLPITLRIAALAFPFHLSPTLSTCGP